MVGLLFVVCAMALVVTAGVAKPLSSPRQPVTTPSVAPSTADV
jgi:hypothetical protein